MAHACILEPSQPACLSINPLQRGVVNLGHCCLAGKRLLSMGGTMCDNMQRLIGPAFNSKWFPAKKLQVAK